MKTKKIQFGRLLQCCYYWWDWFMRYTIEMASHGKIYIRSFMKIGSSIQLITSIIWEVVVLALPTRGTSYVCRWDHLKCHDINTKSHDDRLRHSSTMKDITSTIWETIVLCYWWQGFMIYAIKMVSGVMIFYTRIHEDWYRRSSNIN
jgi:hypothetical protein